jgi:GTP pyrophosphokinase
MNRSVTIEDVIAKASEYLKKQKNLDLIMDAYLVAKEKHEGQFRKSKDPYIQHPLEVAYMLAELHSSPTTIAAGLLHDILEDTDITKEQLIEKFGTDVVNIVDGVTKIGKLKYMTKEKTLARSHQKILLAMAKDIRVVLVKLLDRVHNMRTLEYQTPEKQIKIAQETMDLYAPLAHRLGMYRIKAELEDIAFRYLHPEESKELIKQIKIQKEVRDEDIRKMEQRIDELLRSNNLKNYEIKGRVKNIYSVYKKMAQKELELDQIYDLMALRVLVPTIESCYLVLGLIHGLWTPIPRRFKDYIATPKPNLYQSLHTTIVGIGGKIYEIQIRTKEMDEIAEYGVAAHWAYKEDNKGYSPEKEQLEISSKLKWYKELLSYVEMNENEDNDPLDDIKEDIFSANVYVFTPKGDVLDFPTGATPLDFAYRIHTEVGNTTVGAIVNNRIVPLSYKLKTGDVVEIKTSKNFNGPSEAWVKLVKTSHAKHKIISILNKRKRDELIERGKEEYEKTCKAENINVKLDDKLVATYFSKYGVNSLDDFYVEIGKGRISAKSSLNKISGKIEKFDEQAVIKQLTEAFENDKVRKSSNEWGIIVPGLDKAQIKLANCCHPVYNDSIVGYVTKGHGIVVHRIECNNSKTPNSERYIDVLWDEEYQGKKPFETMISVLSFDRRNIVADLINMMNSFSVHLIGISSSLNRDGDLLTKIKFTVQNTDILNNIITNLYKVSDVYSIDRVIK